MSIPSEAYDAIENGIHNTIEEGKSIRHLLAQHSNQGPYNAEWEVEAAVEAQFRFEVDHHLPPLHHRPRRFNEMKSMLTASPAAPCRTNLFPHGRRAGSAGETDGPPVKVSHELSHTLTCGRLLSLMVAHLVVAGPWSRLSSIRCCRTTSPV